jgi:hypothetical protein
MKNQKAKTFDCIAMKREVQDHSCQMQGMTREHKTV